MKRFALGSMAALAAFAAVAPASAQGRWDRWRDRGPVYIERSAPAIGVGTVAAILALQALQAQQQKETTVIREREVERVQPLK